MIMLNMNGLTRSNFMNKYEEYFIKKFIYQNKRDRFIYEFTKKREETIDRFSHDINKYIIDKRIEKVINKLDYDGFRNLFKNDTVYILSNTYIDGVIFNIEDAFNYTYNESNVVIILKDDLALIKTENEGGISTYYFLK